ncbi:unnamed protein product [Didymodactylos carnosus]|uniref:TIR domain-containing protein n=1 Tax=Didymodactylos carnosus TaxID=1234261 RepID=A0A813VWY5_9BILA|nr:unnamed protein product [Didymodactylos carnosus]CAF1482682.1 unnamed protein product [Didymodactylos carnosus]CAF3639884.1 unnamed protein product [Didymodactylos carnosus]CAF4272933.1 unnamed protein product [Didymodactylos carnosus]
MADGIENAAAICCFITSKYQSSPYCKKELLYAENRGIPVIPCLMDADHDWMPTNWLGYTIIDILYLDFRDLISDNSPENLETKCNQLIERIRSVVGTNFPSEMHQQQQQQQQQQHRKQPLDFDNQSEDWYPV